MQIPSFPNLVTVSNLIIMINQTVNVPLFGNKAGGFICLCILSTWASRIGQQLPGQHPRPRSAAWLAGGKGGFRGQQRSRWVYSVEAGRVFAYRRFPIFVGVPTSLCSSIHFLVSPPRVFCSGKVPWLFCLVQENNTTALQAELRFA